MGIEKGVLVYTHTDRPERAAARDDVFSPAESEGDLMSCVSVGSNNSR